jgi:hypothetical protein
MEEVSPNDRVLLPETVRLPVPDKPPVRETLPFVVSILLVVSVLRVVAEETVVPPDTLLSVPPFRFKVPPEMVVDANDPLVLTFVVVPSTISIVAMD